MDHSARTQRQHRQLGRVVTHPRSLQPIDGRSILVDIAVRAGSFVFQFTESCSLALQASLDPHDVTVGLKLRKRETQQLSRRLRVIGTNQVGGHVVRRPER